MPFIALGPLFYPPGYPARTPAREVIVAEGGHLLGVNTDAMGAEELRVTFIASLYCSVLAKFSAMTMCTSE